MCLNFIQGLFLKKNVFIEFTDYLVGFEISQIHSFQNVKEFLFKSESLTFTALILKHTFLFLFCLVVFQFSPSANAVCYCRVTELLLASSFLISVAAEFTFTEEIYNTKQLITRNTSFAFRSPLQSLAAQLLIQSNVTDLCSFEYWKDCFRICKRVSKYFLIYDTIYDIFLHGLNRSLLQEHL